MSNFARGTNFKAKDDLPTGDPGKLAKGTEVDDEFNLVQTAVNSKYDSADLATEGQAEAGSSTSVLMSPQRVNDYVAYITATTLEAETGTSDVKLMTPLKTNDVLDDLGLLATGSPTFDTVTADLVGDVDGDVTAGTNLFTSTGMAISGGLVTVINVGAAVFSQPVFAVIASTSLNLTAESSFLSDNTSADSDTIQVKDSGDSSALRFSITQPQSTDDVEFRDGAGNTLVTFDATDQTVDFEKMPYVNGGTLPCLQGHLYGLGTSTSGTTDIAVAAGTAADYTGEYGLVSAGLTKQIDNVWAPGTAAGGFPSTLSGGSPAIDTWYRVFLIGHTDGSTDAGFDSVANSDASALLADTSGYTLYRQIGWILTDGSSDITPYHQTGDKFIWDVPPRDVTGVSWSTSAALHTVSAPPDTDVIGLFDLSMYHPPGAAVRYILFTATRQTDSTPSSSINTFYLSTDNDVHGSKFGRLELLMDTSSQIRSRGTSSSPSNSISTQGWIDKRGA